MLADNVDPMASGSNAGIMNHGKPPEDSPMDVFQSIFISHHPAETSVGGVFGTVPWQLVSCSQQVLLQDKQDASAQQLCMGAVRFSSRTDKVEVSLKSSHI